MWLVPVLVALSGELYSRCDQIATQRRHTNSHEEWSVVFWRRNFGLRTQRPLKSVPCSLVRNEDVHDPYIKVQRIFMITLLKES